jgi:transposase
MSGPSSIFIQTCDRPIGDAKAALRSVHFHYTPTHASWLNQIEIWFSILARKSLDGQSFTSVPELVQHIDDFISDYNKTATPFV